MMQAQKWDQKHNRTVLEEMSTNTDCYFETTINILNRYLYLMFGLTNEYFPFSIHFNKKTPSLFAQMAHFYCHN
jgi:hypothetical protein